MTAIQLNPIDTTIPSGLQAHSDPSTNIPDAVPSSTSESPLDNVELCKLPSKEQFASLDETFKQLMGSPYDPSDIIDQWVYSVLGESFCGNNKLLNKHLNYLKNAHPENQEALLSAAYALANQMGHESICKQLLSAQSKPLSFSNKPLQIDKIKEVNTPLIDELSHRDQKAWYLRPALILGLGIFALSLSTFDFAISRFGFMSGFSIAYIDQVYNRLNVGTINDVARLNILKLQLQKSNGEDAIDDLRHMRWDYTKDKALNLIGNKALREGNLRLAERAARKLNSNVHADSLWIRCIQKYLDQEGNLDHAMKAATSIFFEHTADEAFTLITEKALAEGNIDYAMKAATSIFFEHAADEAFILIIEKALAEGKNDLALNIAGRMHFAHTADEALLLIGTKALEKRNFDLAERAAKSMHFDHTARLLRRLTSLERCRP